MSIKSSVLWCFSNAVVKVLLRNCWQRTLNIVVIKYFRIDTFETKKTITATEVVLTQLLSYNVVSKHKNKNENTEYHGIFISFKSHLYSKEGSPICLLFGSWSLALFLLV